MEKINKNLKVLGIDYGRKKIGLAFGDTQSRFSEPFETLRYEDVDSLYGEISKIISEHEIDQLVIGVSEGEMEEETKKFGKSLEEKLKLSVIFQDETLSTHDAKELSISAGINRKKRKDMEDAYAASIILQSYLDSQI